MAKNKRKKPWGIDEPTIKDQARKSLKAKKEDVKGDRKMIRVYADTHRKIKLMAFENDMTMNDYMEYMVEEYWKSRTK